MRAFVNSCGKGLRRMRLLSVALLALSLGPRWLGRVQRPVSTPERPLEKKEGTERERESAQHRSCVPGLSYTESGDVLAVDRI